VFKMATADRASRSIRAHEHFCADFSWR